MHRAKHFQPLPAAFLAAGLICAPVRSEEALTLEVRLYSARVTERTPFVVGLRVYNPSDQPVTSVFSLNDAPALVRQSTLVVTDPGGTTHRLFRVGGPGVSWMALRTGIPFPPGASLAIDRIFSLMTLRPPGEQQGNGIDAIYRFLDPGTYKAHVEVNAGPGGVLTSTEFELTILPATGSDAAARDEVCVRHADFLEGFDPPLGEEDYDGRKLHGKVDVSKFGELQRILDEHSDSPYAQWIRYWKLYHHGPAEQALQFAREHRDFPLSDNLMLRVAERSSGGGDYKQARAVVEELLRDFPDGDARGGGLSLQQRLTKKP